MSNEITKLKGIMLHTNDLHTFEDAYKDLIKAVGGVADINFPKDTQVEIANTADGWHVRVFAREYLGLYSEITGNFTCFPDAVRFVREFAKDG